MTELQRILQYYKDCYQIDQRGIRIGNFLSRQCEKRRIPTNNDFFQENYQGVYMNVTWAASVDKHLLLHAKEKALYAGTIFIKLTSHVLGKEQIALIPLYIHELALKKEVDNYFLMVTDTYFNPDFIDAVNQLDDRLKIKMDLLSEKAPANPFGFDNQVLLDDFLNTYFQDWNRTDLENYSKDKFNYNTYFKKSQDVPVNSKKLFSCLMFGIFKKSESSIGIINELRHLSKLGNKHSLLNTFFGIKPFSIQKMKARNIYLPTTLSINQESAFFAADVYPISQIIGPPGTGKSYTIASLAIDLIINNKSVLLVTRNKEAGKVITNIIENEFKFKGGIIKAFDNNYRRSLRSTLKKTLGENFRFPRYPNDLKTKIDRKIISIQKVEQEILRTERDELNWGYFYAENKNNLVASIKSKWIQYQKKRKTPVWKLNETLKKLRKEKNRLVKQFIKRKRQYRLDRFITNESDKFLQLSACLQEKNTTLFDKKLNELDFNIVLKAVPLWATTTRKMSGCLPLHQGLFDYVIIDESSQCDVASVLPAIHRAKKLIVVGDPKQLNHISFVSNKKLNELKDKYEIQRDIPHYRKQSLIDWTDDLLVHPDQIAYLDEHFRSRTNIIQFSNKMFYNNELKLIRSNPSEDSYKSVQIIPCNGTRSATGYNELETEILLQKLNVIMHTYEDANPSFIPSIGIISPFAQQIKYIKKKLAEQFDLSQLKKHRVLVGTPFHFQGEERDYMLISFCIDNQSHSASINYLNKKDIFNVLITRARNQQFLFTSFNSKQLPAKSLLKAYIESEHRIQPPIINREFDYFRDDVIQFLIRSDVQMVKESTFVAGVPIDIVLLSNGQHYCIELIGYPGAFEEQFNLSNLRILNRMKTPIFFLPYSNWFLDKRKSKKDLLIFLQRRETI